MRNLRRHAIPGIYTLVTAVALACPTLARAQDTATDTDSQAPALTTATAGKPGPNGWLFTTTFSFAALTGNAESKTLQLSGSFLRSWPDWGITAKATGLRQSAGEGADIAEAYFVAVEGSRKITDWVALVAGASAYRNPFAGLDHRNLLGAGARWTIADTPQHRFDLLTAAGWEHDNYIAEVGEDNLPTSFVQLEDVVHLTATSTANAQLAYFQDLRNSGNYRIAADASLQSQITSWLGLNVAFALAFDNEPVAASKKTDTSFTAGFEFNLRGGQ